MHIAIIKILSTPAINELKEVFSGMNKYREALKSKKIITIGRTNFLIFALLITR